MSTFRPPSARWAPRTEFMRSPWQFVIASLNYDVAMGSTTVTDASSILSQIEP